MNKGRQNVGLEGDTDYLVRSFLDEIKVTYTEQGTNIKEIDKALIGASKSENGRGKGKPEFIFSSGNHLFVVENKKANEKLELIETGEVITEYPARNDFAVNGAVHYAKHIVEKAVGYKEVIAIGVTGDSHYYQIQPYYVTENEVRRLDDLKSFEDFSEVNVTEYWRVAINGELPKEERDLQTVKDIAGRLHEDLRNYGNLEGERKATVVSAILLALEEETFSTDDLKAFNVDGQRDGDKIFGAIETYLRRINFHERYEKYGVLMDSFNFLKTDTTLNTYNPTLDKTPLKYYAEQLDAHVVDLMKSENEIDILGNFYGEFVKYGGNDGNPLGIVLTPRHITSLMAELIDIRPHDYVLDPACGSGAFLISAMIRMLSMAKTEEEKQDIRQNHLYGIELQGKLFTIATTNMILRGDGKSNLIKGDMFHVEDANLKGNTITKVLMNPPYSQAKTKDLVHLSEISFIKRALEMMKPEGKLAAIVPQSTMVGKTKEAKLFKKQILEKNTLEAVITLNTDTFYPVGVHPCICIFKAKIPHNFGKQLVKFIDFSDDGYSVRKHVGLVGNGSQDSKREHLIDVINGNADDGNKFIVRTTITPDDEWLHAFYYFNEEIPAEDNFKKAIADYLTFQFDMSVHGRSYLFEEREDDE